MIGPKPFYTATNRLEMSEMISGEAKVLERVQVTRSRALAIVDRHGAILLVTLKTSNAGEFLAIIGNSVMGYGSLRDLSEALGRVATATQAR